MLDQLFVAIFLVLAAQSAAQTASADGKEQGPPAPHSAAIKSNAPSVFELLRTRYRFENDGSGRKEVIAKIRVLNEMGTLQLAEQTFEYHPLTEELQILYIRVRKKDGTVVTVATNTIQRRPNSVTPKYDLDERHVRIPRLVVGDLVEYHAVTVIHRPLGPGEFCVNHTFQPSDVLDEQLEVNVPRSRELKVKTVQSVKAWETTDSLRKVYHWENQNPGPRRVAAKPYVPGRTPDVQISTFLTWEEVGRWYSALERTHRAPSPAVRAKADELTQGLNSDLEKVEALYNFAAKKIKYISLVSLGIGGYEPHSAEETIHNGYGDCKDKTALLRALLEVEGLHASSVLISADRKLDLDIPSPWSFDHAIAVLQLGKNEIWMDPSLAVLPFRMLAYPLRGKQALVLPTNGTVHFETTPADAPVSNTWSEEIAGTVGQDGTLHATVKITARGDGELPIRQAFIGPVESVWPITVQGVVNGINRKVDKIDNVKISDPTHTNEPFTLSFGISKPHFFDLSMGATQFKLPLSNFPLPPAEKEGVADAGEYAYKIRLEFQSNIDVIPPQPVAINSSYAAYDAKYRLDGNALIAERKLFIHRDKLPAAIAENYDAFREKVLADEAKPITLQGVAKRTRDTE